MMLIRDRDLTIRKMKDAGTDYALMLHWLTDDRVAEHYGGRDQKFTLEKIKEKYGRKIREFAHMTPCIIERSRKPIGYLQFYETCRDGEPTGKEPLLWLASGTYNVDMFIGEPDLWNRGIGNTVLRMTAQHLLQNGSAKVVTIDPKTVNERAIRAYEKAGFRKVQLLPKWEEHEGKWYDNWLMQYEPNTNA